MQRRIQLTGISPPSLIVELKSQAISAQRHWYLQYVYSNIKGGGGATVLTMFFNDVSPQNQFDSMANTAHSADPRSGTLYPHGPGRRFGPGEFLIGRYTGLAAAGDVCHMLLIVEDLPLDEELR